MTTDIAALWGWEMHPSRILYSFKDTGGGRQRWTLCHGCQPIPPEWFVETQHYGFMIWLAGLRNQASQADLGVKILDFGLEQQTADGGFAGDDAHHSAAFFYEILARFLILAPKTVSVDRETQDLFSRKLRKGVEWFAARRTWDDGWWRDNMHHRFFLNAAVIILTQAAIGDLPAYCFEQAEAWLMAGISRQRDDGAITELGGHDTGYHSLAITFACGILLCDGSGESTRRALKDCVEQAAAWLAGRVDEQGRIDGSGNSRMTPDSGEKSRQDGAPKGIKYYETAFAFAGAAAALKNPEWLQIADRIMKHYNPDHSGLK